MNRTLTLAALVCASAGLAGAAEQNFYTFASSNGGGSGVFGLSADGGAAAGVSDGRAYRWTPGGGTQYLTSQDYFNVFTAGISADGQTVVSSQQDEEGLFTAARWTQGSGWETLGGLPGQTSPDGQALSVGFGVSGDGSKVVGLGWHSNFRAEAAQWTQGTGMVGLGKPDDGSSRASAISADGHTAVGFYEGTGGERRPARWTDMGSVDLFLGDTATGETGGINSDGSMITGGLVQGSAFPSAFLFTNSGTVNLGVLQDSGFGFDESFGNAVSDTGIVVGWSGDRVIARTQDGFIWTPDTGMLRASEYLASLGLMVPSNLMITTVTSVSADGLSFGGQAFDLNDPMGFTTVSWVATVPTPGSALFGVLAMGGLRRRRR